MCRARRGRPIAVLVVPMSDGGTAGDYRDFKESFLAEAEEHLQVIEHAVLGLEDGLGQERADPLRVNEFFRAAHTVKALAAMLEYEPVVELCHRLESVLRAIDQGTLPFTAATVDPLVDGARTLASLVDDIRADRTLPTAPRLLERLDDLLSMAAPPASIRSNGAAASRDEKRFANAVAAGESLYEIRFRPTPALADRAITITAVRESLARIGRVLEVRPVVPTDGQDGVIFVLTVATAEELASIVEIVGGDSSAVQPLKTERRVEPWIEDRSSREDGQGRSSVVRVDVARLDELMRLVGELVIARARINRAIAELKAAGQHEALVVLEESSQRMERHLHDLREAVMRVRMVPIREAFGRIPLVVRDTARAAGKNVRVELIGEDTEVDKMLVDRLIDPLVHLVRNAVDHGLEPGPARTARGKPEVGRVVVAARQEGDRVVVDVSDDGNGIDRDRVAAKAELLGFDHRDLHGSDDALLQVLCLTGLSTRDQAGRTSGRGVGMDVVRQRVAEMNGSLELSTRAGEGTTFTMRLPLTLVIVDALTAISGGQRFAVAIATVEEVAEIPRAAIVSFEGNEIIQHRGQVLPLLRLNTLFRLAQGPASREYLHGLVVSVGGSRSAIAVDRLLGEQEVVVKTLTDALVRTPGVIGATDLGDGEPVLILDIPELVRLQRDQRAASVAAEGVS